MQVDPGSVSASMKGSLRTTYMCSHPTLGCWLPTMRLMACCGTPTVPTCCSCLQLAWSTSSLLFPWWGCNGSTCQPLSSPFYPPWPFLNQFVALFTSHIHFSYSELLLCISQIHDTMTQFTCLWLKIILLAGCAWMDAGWGEPWQLLWNKYELNEHFLDQHGLFPPFSFIAGPSWPGYHLFWSSWRKLGRYQTGLVYIDRFRCR